MEKAKTFLLVFLVALSLLQSYYLAYKLPNFKLSTSSQTDYVNTELLGHTKSIDEVLFPSQLVIHLSKDEHTIINPNSQFYDLIVSQRLANREFKSFQLVSQPTMDWEQIRREHRGIELSFTEGISIDLLKRVLKMEISSNLSATVINRIYIYAIDATEEVKAYFFSDKQKEVYESIDVDLTVKDIQDYVGFGQYLPRYLYMGKQLYLASEPIQARNLRYGYSVISPEEMQRSLFFDSSTTRAFVNRSGSQIYTDGKRGLQVEQNGLWIVYTNSTATQTSNQDASEDVFAAVEFINNHGGWDTSYQLTSHTENNTIVDVGFRKYIGQYPIIDISPFRYSRIDINTHQGVVMEYERTMIQLSADAAEVKLTWLYGGTLLMDHYYNHPQKDEIVSIYPALKPFPQMRSTMEFNVVWAAKLVDGSEIVFMDSIPAGIDPAQLKQ